jgi:hypothetical protein
VALLYEVTDGLADVHEEPPQPKYRSVAVTMIFNILECFEIYGII